MPPPADFAGRKLQFIEVAPKTLFRIHLSAYGPVFYGTSGNCRLDDPKREFGVLYAADTLVVALAETVIRETAALPAPGGVIGVPKRLLAMRSVSMLKAKENLRLANLTGTSLFALGGNAAELQSNDYADSQPWSAATYYRSESPNDGILYQSRYINTNTAVAIFDRGGQRVALEAEDTIPLLNHPDLDAALDGLNVALI